MKLTTRQTTAFGFEGKEVRSTYQNGEPWFVAKDVCEILGLKNPNQVIAALRDHQKGVHSMDTLGGRQNLAVVSEGGLYALIFKSRKPEAERFCDWVTDELLPTLRKTGFYALSCEPLQEKADWELSRARCRIALLRELQALEREPKEGVEYLGVSEFLNRQGIKLGTKSEALRFARQVQMACQSISDWPVKVYRKGNRIPSTLWPEPVLRQCMSLLPAPEQPALALN